MTAAPAMTRPAVARIADIAAKLNATNHLAIAAGAGFTHATVRR